MVYYQDEFVTIINGDVADVLPTLPQFDMVFADPPFNVNVKYDKYKDKLTARTYYDWQSAWLNRVVFFNLKEQSTLYLMTITRHLPETYKQLASLDLRFINQVVWKNVSSVSTRRNYWQQYQPILMYGKGEYHFDTYAETRDTGVKRWGGYSTEHKGQMGDIWDDIPFVYAGSIHHKEAILKPGTNKKEHPAQMPEKLARRMLAFSCPTGGTALDVFMGSGSLLRAAKDMGIKATGIEISEYYCELAAKRMQEDRAPLLKFVTNPPTQQSLI